MSNITYMFFVSGHLVLVFPPLNFLANNYESFEKSTPLLLSLCASLLGHDVLENVPCILFF